MKKFINRVDDMLAESLRGFADAHQGLVLLQMEPTFVRRADAAQALDDWRRSSGRFLSLRPRPSKWRGGRERCSCRARPRGALSS